LFQREARGVEFFEVSIARGHEEQGERCSPGVRAHAVIVRGTVAISVDDTPATTLNAGDAIVFAADAEHSYRNTGDTTAILYLVLHDPDPRAFED
jgi:quercetin dioxygenase-like cupin family protein